MMKKIIAGVAAAALAVSAMATSAFAATETKTIDVDLYNGTGATTDLITYTATATVKLPTTLTATTGATITSSVGATDTLATGAAEVTEVKILGAVSNAGIVTASVLGTEAGKFAKGNYAEVTVVYTFVNATDDKAELTADQLTAVNTDLKAATIELDGAKWKAGDEAIGTAWTSAAIGDTTAVKDVKTSNAEAAVNKTFKLKAAEKAALKEAGAAKVVLTIVSESNYTAGTEYAATIGDATVKVKPAADTKTLTFETDLTALYSAEYDEWATLSVTTVPACLTAKLAISYEAEVEETEDTSADETDVTEDTSAEDTTAPEDTSAEDTSADDTSADDTTAPEDTSADDTTAEGDTGADAGEGEDGENGKGDNTETGVVLAVVPAIVAGAALVVSRKRK